MQTQQIKNLFLGHMFSIQDIAPAPEAWPGAENLFATCARSGDVKLWDVRSRTGAAVVTLTGGDYPLQAVVLAANSGSGSTGTARGAAAATISSNQLGAGMLCFAGGVDECVWAWDLRNGSAQSLYQLSTGNLMVEALAWHEGSSSLIASCENIHQNRFGECYRDDFMKVGEKENPLSGPLGALASALGIPPSALAGLAGFGGDSGEESSEENEAGDGGNAVGEQARYWPREAKHRPEDFRAHLSLGHSCVLAYTFSERASQEVPYSQEPVFAGEW